MAANKTGSIFATAFIGLIVVSFMFSGYQSFQGSPDTIAKVGNLPIKYREFQIEYNRQIKFYSQIFGGKDLTAKQIKDFKIRPATLRNLVNQKLMIKFAEELGINPGPEEIKQTIKEQPYFQTNKQFNVVLYKNILAQNRLTPSDYEENVKTDIMVRNIQNIFSNFPLSDNYISDLVGFKKQKLAANLVKISKADLKTHILVSNTEIDNYLAKAENLSRVTTIFKSRQGLFNKPEQIKARHILLTTGKGKKDDAVKLEIEKISKEVNPSNFKKLANKYTQDPSGKGKGGDLGWFSKGRMVPAFEKVAFSLKPGTISKPLKTDYGQHIIYLEDKKNAVIAKLDDHKIELARELIQKQKNAEGIKLAESLKSQITQDFKTNNISAIQKLQRKYKFSFEKEALMNRFEGATGKITLPQNKLSEIFEKKSTNNPYIIEDATSITMAQVFPAKENKKGKSADENKKIDPATEKSGLANALSKTFNEQVLKSLEEKVKVKVYNESVL